MYCNKYVFKFHIIKSNDFALHSFQHINNTQRLVYFFKPLPSNSTLNYKNEHKIHIPPP